MIALEIESKGSFMKKLLAEEYFDNYYLKEAVISTFTRFEISGERNSAYYSDEELAAFTADSAEKHFVLWSEVRKTAYELIKGKRLPVYMHVVLMAPAKLAPESAGASDEFLLTLRYKDGGLTAVTGVNHKAFPFDKASEREWDEKIKGLLA